jgi:uncharacterized protein
MNTRLPIGDEALAQFCERHHIRRLALFGSTLKGIDRPDSDIDLLVEFEADHIPGLLGMAGMERELSGCSVAAASICAPLRNSRGTSATMSCARPRCSLRDEDSNRVRHMVDAAESALGFMKGRSRADLDKDKMLLFAVVRALEIVGEAASKV